MTQEALKLALEALETGGWNKTTAAITAIKEALAQPEFIKHKVENADDWSEWVCPNPESYLMKCCDCGLVHEAQFKVVRYKSEDDREDCDMVDDPNLQAVFRMRRSEQWLPEDTAHRAGGLPMAQPEQEPVAWMSEHRFDELRKGFTVMTTLTKQRVFEDDVAIYTTPPQRKPLTDEMRKQMKERCDSMEMRGAFVDGWLSAEAAHGIKENT